MKLIVGNWPGTSQALVKYPGESLGLGIYSKPMRPIQKSVSEPIRVIPNKSETSFNLYQSEAHLKSIRMNPANPNQFKLSIRINPKLTGFIRIEISDLFGLFLNFLRVDSDWKFALESFGIARFSSESDSGMNRNSADWLGMNFNPELSPGWNYMMFKFFFKLSNMLSTSFP